MVINFFRFIAEEVRHLMAGLGISRFEDLIGRTDLLELKEGETELLGKRDTSSSRIKLTFVKDDGTPLESLPDPDDDDDTDDKR